MVSKIMEMGACGPIKAIYRQKDGTLYGVSVAGRLWFSGPHYKKAPRQVSASC